MRKTTGKKGAITSGVVLLVVLGVTVFASRHWLRETWLIHKLGTDEVQVRNDAAAQLAEMKSLRAVPRLVELIGRDRGEIIEFIFTSRRGFAGRPGTAAGRPGTVVGRPGTAMCSWL